MLQAAQIRLSGPLLDELPYPVLWIAEDHAIDWRNHAARVVYGSAPGRCHQVTHGYPDPCDRHGERCPKSLAEEQRRAVSVNHAHATREGPELFKVSAIPIAEGGILEVHVPLEDVLARDKLTGLYSRSFFEQLAYRQLALLQRLESSYSVILLDLDRFKQVNDAYGHAAGDEVLQRVGEILMDSIRRADSAGRWGGEEFCVLLPVSGPAGAYRQAERIRDDVRTIRVAGRRRVTASFGVASGSAHVEFEEVCKRADRALYRAKSAGRDRIAVA